MGIPRHQLAVTVNEGNRAVGPENDVLEKLLDALQFYRAEHQSEEFAVKAGNLAGDLNDPGSRSAIAYRCADNGSQLFVLLQCREKVSIRDVDVGDRPEAREVEYLALGIDQGQGPQMLH